MDDATMAEGPERSFFEHLLQGGPLQLFVIVFTIFCTVWLVVSRIRRSFQFRTPTPGRDLVLLSVGPVCVILHSLCRAAIGTMALIAGGIDADFGIRYGLSDVVIVSVVAFYCFIPGVISFLLPTKAKEPS